MADFSNLKKLDVTNASEAEYVFEDIVLGKAEDGTDICPSIWFRPMTDANSDYLNERVRMAVERAEAANKETRSQRRQRVLSADQLEEDRDLDRILMARTCAIRWGTPMPDTEGKTHDLDEEQALAFFRALPNHMFDPCRGFVGNVYNFFDRAALTAEKKDQLGN